MTADQPDRVGEFEPPVVRDKRRIDPETGAVRPDLASGVSDVPVPGAGPTASAPAGPPPGGPAEPADTGPAPVADPGSATEDPAVQLAERTADLQRLQAEYVNYRRRVERDRESVRELAVIGALVELLPVLDDIGRAREHGELTGGFKVVADSLEAALGKLGLVAYGEEGESFDPTVHEALMHEYSTEVAEPTCVAVLQPGYRVGERVVRAARVKVAEPEPTDPSGDGPEPEG